jgi:glyoxylase-like metal-dependent hydrolase (beta-lactamase superfamily II)
MKSLGRLIKAGPLLLLAAMTFGVRPVTVSAGAPLHRVQAPGYYRLTLGSYEVTVLSDGTHPFPDAAVLTKPKPASGAVELNLFLSDASEARSLLAAADSTAPTEGSINAFLINTGTKLILIDTGAGSLYGRCCGKLRDNLRAAGYHPDQVDDIFLTHLHEDHVGGIAPNGIMAFPNAIVHVSKADADYWLNDAHEKAAPAFLHSQFEGARISVRPYQARGRFRTFSGSGQLAPGLRAIAAPGHTPGHTFYEVESEGHKLLIWGDVVHVAELQFPDPSISTEYDWNPKLAEATRRNVFARAATSGVMIGAMHVSFPGIGHVVKRGSSYAWIPAPYTTRL